MKPQIQSSSTKEIAQQAPTIEIQDPYAFTTGTTCIALLRIKCLNGEEFVRHLKRTKNRRYMLN